MDREQTVRICPCPDVGLLATATFAGVGPPEAAARVLHVALLAAGALRTHLAAGHLFPDTRRIAPYDVSCERVPQSDANSFPLDCRSWFSAISVGESCAFWNRSAR